MVGMALGVLKRVIKLPVVNERFHKLASWSEIKFLSSLILSLEYYMDQLLC